MFVNNEMKARLYCLISHRHRGPMCQEFHYCCSKCWRKWIRESLHMYRHIRSLQASYWGWVYYFHYFWKTWNI